MPSRQRHDEGASAGLFAVPIAAGVFYPPTPCCCHAAMAAGSVSVMANALRLRKAAL